MHRPTEHAHAGPRRLGGAGLLFLWGIACLYAEQLPIKTYTTAEGLARDGINRIVQDSRGFIWFCTWDGLSRFDGYRFTNFTPDDGLPHRSVTDLVETRPGVYWVATWGGLCRSNPAYRQPPSSLPAAARAPSLQGVGGAADRPFILYLLSSGGKEPRIQSLWADPTGTLWCGTRDGLYQVTRSQDTWTSRFVALPRTEQNPDPDWVTALRGDPSGNLWIGTLKALYRRTPAGALDPYPIYRVGLDPPVRALSVDPAGRLWIGTDSALGQLAPAADPTQPTLVHRYTRKEGLPGRVRSLFTSSDGTLWVGTLGGGLSEFRPSAAQGLALFRSYTTAEGLSHNTVEAITEDRQGNLWLGTEGSGAMRWARRGFVTYQEADGLHSLRVRSIFQNRCGELCVLSGGTTIHRFDGLRFIATPLPVPEPIQGWNQTVFQDHTGDWWVPTAHGLYRFASVHPMEKLAQSRPKAVYTRRDGLPSDAVSCLFEDAQGNLWIGAGALPGVEPAGQGTGLVRWHRATNTFERFSEADGLSLSADTVVTAIGADRAGHFWIGLGLTGLARYRNGCFKLFRPGEEGLPAGAITRLHVDQAGRLWIGTSRGGAACLPDPTADPLRFRVYSTAEDLSSNEIKCFTEDRCGRIYIGTGRGVDRLDPATGQIQRLSIADGLARGEVSVAFRDRQERLWFGTLQGLSRLMPEPAPSESDDAAWRPPVYIRALRVNGVPHPLSGWGASEVPPMALGADQNQIQIDYVGLSFASGERLQYRCRLEGADRDWSAPTEAPTIRYANLSPGAYRFWVQAITAHGMTSPRPARVDFTILPPIWRRGWFMVLAVLTLSGGALGFHRLRVRQILTMERIRRQIAMDLHDDIGAGLAQVAILSEITKSDATPAGVERLDEVAALARTMRDAMSDIVWSVDPRKDRLADLIRRMRQVASHLLEAQGLSVQFQAPALAEIETISLAPDRRRHLLLIFKEALTNIVRHAHAQHVGVTIELTARTLSLRIRDDGCGFDAHAPYEGNGLHSLRQRAAALEAQWRIESSADGGTTLHLRVPLTGR